MSCKIVCWASPSPSVRYSSRVWTSTSELGGGRVSADLATQDLHRLDARAAKRGDERGDDPDEQREDDAPHVERRALVDEKHVGFYEALGLRRELAQVVNRNLAEHVAESAADERDDHALHQKD